MVGGGMAEDGGLTKRRWLIWVAAAVLVAVLGWLGFPYIETARLWYGVTGIDVSHHQGRIDWPVVAGSGVAFAYLKASEGGDFGNGRTERFGHTAAAKVASLIIISD